MNNKKLPLYELWFLLIGEIIVSAIVCAVYLIIKQFSYKVVTGVTLGTAVIFFNFLFLALSTIKVFTEAEAARGQKEMTEEEIEKFVKENQAKYNTAVRTSLLIRNATMMAALVIAFLLDWFDVLATLVPLMAYRPILSLAGLINSKRRKENK